jgi:hypothetical protein
MIDHDARSHELIASVFAGRPAGLTRDDILDNITLYWLTDTGPSAARLYWENARIVYKGEVSLPAALRSSRTRSSVRPGAGSRGRSRTSSTSTRSTRAGISRRGRSRSSSPKRFARRSGRCASRTAGRRRARGDRWARMQTNGRRSSREPTSSSAPRRTPQRSSCPLKVRCLLWPFASNRRRVFQTTLALHSSSGKDENRLVHHAPGR